MKTISVAVPVYDGKYLIAQRLKDEVLGGYWEFPGGKVKEDESTKETARRECLEELGVEVEVGDLLCVTEFEYSHDRVVLHFHSAEVHGSLPGPECPREWRLVDASHLSDFTFPEANADLLRILQTMSGDL